MQKYDFVSTIDGTKSACHVYLLKAASVHYFGFEEIGGGKNVTDCIEQISQDMVIKYKCSEYNTFFFKWFPRYQNRGIEQIEFIWDGPFPVSVSKIRKFCEYKNNPFFT